MREREREEIERKGNAVTEAAERLLPYTSEIGEEKKSRRKKTLGYVLFVGVSAAVICGMALFEKRTGEVSPWREIVPVLKERWAFLVAAFACFFLIVAGDTVVFRTLSSGLGQKRKLSTCLQTSLFGRYFDRITPWSSGGEPFQILYLTKSGMSSSDACAVAMSRHIIRFFSTAVFVVAVLVFSRVGANAFVVIAACVGLVVGLLPPSFLLLCAFRPRLGERITKGVIGFLSKLRIVKNRERAEEKAAKTVADFLAGIKFLSRNGKFAVLIAFFAVSESFLTHSVPYFVMRSLGSDLPYWETFVLCLYVNYASGFAPTPGGSGLAEVSFYAVFETQAAEGTFFWAVLLWRIAVFYLPVAVGFVLQTLSSVRAIVQLRKGRKGT